MPGRGHLLPREHRLPDAGQHLLGRARGAPAQAATDLYGAAAATSVNEAWTAVGVAAPPVWTAITTLNNVAGARNSNTNLSYVTSTCATAMRFALAGGTGDADLYVKFGSAPTTTSYDCMSAGATNDESCTLNPAKQGTYYVLIRGYSAFSGATFTVSSGNQSQVSLHPSRRRGRQFLAVAPVSFWPGRTGGRRGASQVLRLASAPGGRPGKPGRSPSQAHRSTGGTCRVIPRGAHA